MFGLLLILPCSFLFWVNDTLALGGCSHETVVHLLADVPEDVHRLFQRLCYHGVFLHGDDRYGKVGMQVRVLVIRIPKDERAASHVFFVCETYGWYLTNLG